MVLLGVVIGKCEMPSTDISQENDHAILIVKRQFQFSILLLDIHLWHIEIQWIYKLKILY
jgi:hypothetical protein